MLAILTSNTPFGSLYISFYYLKYIRFSIDRFKIMNQKEFLLRIIFNFDKEAI